MHSRIIAHAVATESLLQYATGFLSLLFITSTTLPIFNQASKQRCLWCTQNSHALYRCTRTELRTMTQKVCLHPTSAYTCLVQKGSQSFTPMALGGCRCYASNQANPARLCNDTSYAASMQFVSRAPLRSVLTPMFSLTRVPCE